MKIRFFIMISLLLPIVMLFGLEGYLGKYDRHTKYLSLLKDSLLKNTDSESDNFKSLGGVVLNIDKGNFSEAAACLRAGKVGGVRCGHQDLSSTLQSISNIDILKGGFNERSDGDIKDFIDNFLKKRAKENVLDYSFNFDYSFAPNTDLESWTMFNQGISNKRYGYFISAGVGLDDKKVTYVNGGSVFQPVITYSNLKTNNMDRVRILAISDSFGAANGLLNKDETWAKELEDQLNKIEDRYEVILLAQGGAGYKDYLRWVEDGYIEEIDPDVVLISFFNNDFNLLHDFEQKFFTEDGQLIYNKLDKELGFYLKCFEKEDDFFGRSLKKAYNIFPNLYRFYKFSSCGEEISRVDSNILIDESGVVANYRRIDSLINVPTFLYQIESKLGWDQGNIKRAILTEIQKNGIRIINKADSQGSNINEKCGDIFRYGYRNCEAFKANTFDGHFNRYYNKMHVEGKIKEIKESIDSALVNIEYKESRNEIINNSDSIIVDYLPNTLFVSNPSYEKSYVGFFRDKSYGYGRSSDNFCVPFDRKGVIINFNRYLTEGREIKISSEFQGAGLGLVSRGYDEQGKVVYGNAIELKPGSPVSFLGSESVRGLVVLSNNKNCDSKNLDNSDEFLLEVELI